jgi:hypothetical protein
MSDPRPQIVPRHVFLACCRIERLRKKIATKGGAAIVHHEEL